MQLLALHLPPRNQTIGQRLGTTWTNSNHLVPHIIVGLQMEEMRTSLHWFYASPGLAECRPNDEVVSITLIAPNITLYTHNTLHTQHQLIWNLNHHLVIASTGAVSLSKMDNQIIEPVHQTKTLRGCLVITGLM